MGKPIFRYHEDIWSEKYRPTKLSDYVTSSDFKEKFEKFIKHQKLKNILLEGEPGTGKSTLANILVSNIDCEVKVINAAEERGIDVVREGIKSFCTTSSFKPFKVLVLEEFSEFTPIAQNALKSLLEVNFDNTRVIMTCNSVDLIIPALRSRFQEFTIFPPTREQVEERCKEILVNEKVEFDNSDLELIIRNFYPDIRKCINYLDQNSVDGQLKLDKEFYKLFKYQQKILDIILSLKEANLHDKVTEIRQLVANTKVRNFITLYKFLFEKIDDYLDKKKIIKGIMIIGNGIKNDYQLADKEINFVTTLLELMELKCLQ